MFLTAAELLTLTGRRQAKKQAAFLRSRQIRHIVNRAGHVVVMREWLTGEQQQEVAGPNFAALKELA